MSYKGLSGGQYKPLSDNQIETIHAASLDILQKTGFTFESGLDDTLALLENAGATIDRTADRIYFPKNLIMDQAATAPERVKLYSRDGQNDLDLTEDRVHLGTGGAAVKILDLDTGDARSSTLIDLYSLGRLVDHLDNIHFFLRPCIPTDIPESEYDTNIYYACLKSTAKHVMSGVNNVDGLQRATDLAAILAGGKALLQARPFISVIASFAISPLKLCTQSTLIMQEASRNRIPVALSAAPMSGSTSPITMAGTLAQLHAEQLAGICICQLTNPGAPLLYGGIPGRAHLASMGYLGGAVECGMMNAAIHQLASHIQVPNYNSSGLTDSKIPDAQAGWEKAATTLLVAMGGSNFVHHAAGMLESMLTVAYEQYVIDDEIIGMCGRVLKGIDVDREHLALDVIESVGPGGNFLLADHTVEHMRSEYYLSNPIADQQNRELWEQDGAMDARTRGRRIARKILAEEPKSYIPEDLDMAIRKKFNILLP